MLSGLYLSFTMGLLALGFGVCILVWGMQNRGNGVIIAKLFGGLIVVFSIIAMSAIVSTGMQIKKMESMMFGGGNHMIKNHSMQQKMQKQNHNQNQNR